MSRHYSMYTASAIEACSSRYDLLLALCDRLAEGEGEYAGSYVLHEITYKLTGLNARRSPPEGQEWRRETARAWRTFIESHAEAVAAGETVVPDEDWPEELMPGAMYLISSDGATWPAGRD